MKRSWTKVFKGRAVTDPEKTFTLEDFQGDGVQFSAKYLGRPKVAKPNGLALALDAMVEAKGYAKQSGQGHRKPIKVVANVSVQGFSTCDEKSGSIVSQNPIHRITAWYPDKSDPELFGIIVKGEGGHTGMAETFVCIVLKSHQAQGILHALRDLMNIVFKQAQPAPPPPSKGPPKKATTATIASALLSQEPNTSEKQERQRQWECAQCTFANSETQADCEMCGNSQQANNKARAPHPRLKDTETYQVKGDIYAVPAPSKSKPRDVSTAVPSRGCSDASTANKFSDYAKPRGILVPTTANDDAFFEADFGTPTTQHTDGDSFPVDFGAGMGTRPQQQTASSFHDYANTLPLPVDHQPCPSAAAAPIPVDEGGGSSFHDYANLPMDNTAPFSKPQPDLPAGPGAGVPEPDGDVFPVSFDASSDPSSNPGDAGSHDYVNLTNQHRTFPLVPTIALDEIDESLFAHTNPFR
eukprot:m.117124 g.117124  ORF g.117124 m.117124 type:complete len:468 (-) comp16393_c0_seq4:354-1757(-)